MLFSEYAVRFCTLRLLFTASNCISVGGPFCIKKVVEATCTPSSTNTSRGLKLEDRRKPAPVILVTDTSNLYFCYHDLWLLQV